MDLIVLFCCIFAMLLAFCGTICMFHKVYDNDCMLAWMISGGCMMITAMYDILPENSSWGFAPVAEIVLCVVFFGLGQGHPFQEGMAGRIQPGLQHLRG